MSPSTRAWFALSLLALLAAATLHTLTLFGAMSLWGALIHLTLFGWISAMICAVNYHTMPVFAARDFPYPGLTWVHLGCFAAGVTLATAGLALGLNTLFVAGLFGEVLAALLFMANALLLIRRGVPRAFRPPTPPLPDQPAIDKLGTRATSASGLSLPLALLLLLLERTGLLAGEWLLATEHLAALGWVLLMIVGVAYHVLPRFSGHGLRGLRWVRIQLNLHLLALLLLVPALGFGWQSLFGLASLLMAVSIVLFAWTILPTLRAIRPAHSLIQVTVKGTPR